MVKSISDALEDFTLNSVGKTCSRNEKIGEIIKKYARDEFKFKLTGNELLIKTSSAMEKWEFSSQSSRISAEIGELLDLKIKLKCEVVPKL